MVETSREKRPSEDHPKKTVLAATPLPSLNAFPDDVTVERRLAPAPPHHVRHQRKKKKKKLDRRRRDRDAKGMLQ